MSSAVRTTPPSAPSFQQPRLHSTYPLEMFKALNPVMSHLKDNFHPGVATAEQPFKVNGQLFGIYETIGNARKSLEERIPRNMFQEGREHFFFKSTRQGVQGDWIKEVYEVLYGIESRIRDYFRKPTDAVTLRNDLITNDKAGAVSLPRLNALFSRFDPITGDIAKSTHTVPHKRDVTTVALSA